jgi:hypothetical protein
MYQAQASTTPLHTLLHCPPTRGARKGTHSDSSDNAAAVRPVRLVQEASLVIEVSIYDHSGDAKHHTAEL